MIVNSIDIHNLELKRFVVCLGSYSSLLKIHLLENEVDAFDDGPPLRDGIFGEILDRSSRVVKILQQSSAFHKSQHLIQICFIFIHLVSKMANYIHTYNWYKTSIKTFKKIKINLILIIVSCKKNDQTKKYYILSL